MDCKSRVVNIFGVTRTERNRHKSDPDAPGKERFKGWVQVETKDGKRMERVVENNWGSLANPMTPEQVRQKFRENAALALPREKVEGVEEMVGRLEEIGDVTEVVDLCVR